MVPELEPVIRVSVARPSVHRLCPPIASPRNVKGPDRASAAAKVPRTSSPATARVEIVLMARSSTPTKNEKQPCGWTSVAINLSSRGDAESVSPHDGLGVRSFENMEDAGAPIAFSVNRPNVNHSHSNALGGE